MTDIEQQNLDAAMREVKARNLRREFDRIWFESLKSKAQTFSRMPASALAFEMAWHGFRAGKASNGR